jgi:hypothetical protein
VPRGVRRLTLLSGVALCAVLGGPIAVAQASDNTIKQTLNHYGPIIKREEAAVKSGIDGYPGSSARLVRALGHEVATLHAMKRKLTSESASTAQGTTGRSDIIKGVTLVIKAYSALRHDVKVANGGPVPASKVNPIVKTATKGNKDVTAGVHIFKKV